MKKRIIFLPILLLVLITPMFSCNNAKAYESIEYIGGSEYQTYYGYDYSFYGSEFSIECPSNYELSDLVQDDVHVYITYGENIKGSFILIDSTSIDNPDYGISTGIIIGKHESVDEQITLGSAIDDFLRYHQKSCLSSFENNLQIIEEKFVNIQDQMGAELIISYDAKPMYINGVLLVSKQCTVIVRAVFFSNETGLWVIILNGDKEDSDQSNVAFEHVVQTLKFLD